MQERYCQIIASGLGQRLCHEKVFVPSKSFYPVKKCLCRQKVLQLEKVSVPRKNVCGP